MTEAGSAWTAGEVDRIVADTCLMLAMELRGEPFVKARRSAIMSCRNRRRGGRNFDMPHFATCDFIPPLAA
ncbi:MAG: hypothetical protein KAG89_01865 [Fulvimarina manganoxydans]|uniref:hypothetical protein n=1 Tax=Fulvimarina manganoxydans TaxID=937218 RepID=UPI002354CBC0|nr:hypothetical protein [Fulvimarina manganoxydans]MCK5930893.1 hypothetical protein [Fulvimarina manganoxydans]